MSDFITLLRHSTAAMAKRWLADGTIKGYDDGKYFRLEERRIASLRALSGLLTDLQDASKVCAIRGKYLGDVHAKATDPEFQSGDVRRKQILFEDAPHQWMLVEVDAFQPLGADPVLQPVDAIEEYIATLPPVFHHASYHWQLSNSAGLPKYKDTLKVHLWFWLEQPATSAQLKAWATAVDAPLDKSVLNTVQIHYTATPVFDRGVLDPVSVRSGFVAKDSDVVQLDVTHLLVATPVVSRLVKARDDDPVVQRLYDRGLVKSIRPDGSLNVECPCSEQHTSESGDTTSVYYLANTGGHSSAAFHCLHAHCLDAPQQEFLDALGFSIADDFDILADEDVSPAHTPEHLARFTPLQAAGFAVSGSTTWLIKGVLPAADLAVLYGASGSGKSFMALDMAMAIARGEPWRGHRTTKGRVAYVCAEGAGGFRRRLQAYAHQHAVPLDQIDLFVIPAAPDLLKGDDVRALIKALKAAGPWALVIMDTFAQVMPGGNENSGEDVGKALGHCKTISAVLGCPILLIHHSGKDETRGARGRSGLRAACDTEMEVIRAEQERALTVTKQKDGEEGQDFGFKLLTVVLGEDDDGDDITSCVVEHTEGTAKAVRKAGKPMGVVEKLVYEVIRDGVDLAGGGLTREAILEAAVMKMELEEGKRDRRRDRARRALDELLATGRVKNVDGLYFVSGSGQ